MRGTSRSSDANVLSSACSPLSFRSSRMLGCTTATRPASRTSSVRARHTPHPAGRTVTSTTARSVGTHRLPDRQRSRTVATRPLTSASQKVTPRAPTISAIPTSSGKPVREVPSPSHGKASGPGKWARTHSMAVHVTGSASHSGARTSFTDRCSIQPNSAAKPISARIVDDVGQDRQLREPDQRDQDPVEDDAEVQQAEEEARRAPPPAAPRGRGSSVTTQSANGTSPTNGSTSGCSGGRTPPATARTPREGAALPAGARGGARALRNRPAMGSPPVRLPPRGRPSGSGA